MDKELQGLFNDLLYIAEISAEPDVPTLEGVNIEELTQGDENPLFVTLPIGKVNVRSGNKRYYDEAFVQELEAQVRNRKPVGIMGHIPEDKLGTEFPDEAVHWVGVMRVGELLWGKGYLPPGGARNRIKRYRATGTKLATSIFAKAHGVWEDAISAYRMIANTLDLGQIDIAPADRAGIGSLAMVPKLTSEMSKEETTMEKDEVVKSLTPADIAALPEAVRKGIVEMQMAEMRKTLGLPADADVTKYLSDMKIAEQERAKNVVTGRITELAKDEKDGIKVESVRELVVDLVKAKGPQTVEDAERIYKEVVESDSVKKALASHVKETMGPPQATPSGSSREEKKGKFFTIPAVKEA